MKKKIIIRFFFCFCIWNKKYVLDILEENEK